jgi:hypothetical protein
LSTEKEEGGGGEVVVVVELEITRANTKDRFTLLLL